MSTRADQIASLRKLADVLEQHPELPMPYQLAQTELTIHYLFDGTATRDRMAAAARAIGGKFDKRVRDGSSGDHYFDLLGRVGTIAVKLTAFRADVCERIVTGTREVSEEMPDPAVEVPTVTVTHTVEDVEWRCAPLLAEVTA